MTERRSNKDEFLEILNKLLSANRLVLVYLGTLHHDRSGLYWATNHRQCL